MTELALLLAGFCVSAVLTPVGISGAFLLVPFQHTVLGVTSVSVTPTNLLFNVLATPGAILRYHRGGRLDRRLATLISAGSLPGVLVGTWARMHLLADPQDRKSTRLNSSHSQISYAVFCLKKKR